MPEIKTYKVTQTREVTVVANSLVNAVTIADRVFKGEPNTGDPYGYATDRVTDTDLAVRESY